MKTNRQLSSTDEGRAFISGAHSEYDEATSVRQMLEADLIAERIVIESYER